MEAGEILAPELSYLALDFIFPSVRNDGGEHMAGF